MATIYGNDNKLYGTPDADAIYGYGGNDYLYGDSGDDTLTGGTSNDSLEGGEGANTYVFSQGDGQDVIYNYDSDGGVDVVQFTDIPSTAVWAASSDRYNLYLYLGSGDRLQIDGG